MQWSAAEAAGVASARPDEVAVAVLPEGDDEGRVAAYHFVVKRGYRFDDSGALRAAPARALVTGDVFEEGAGEGAGEGEAAPRAVSELVPPRPRCDVVVVGHCYPPGGEAVESVCGVDVGGVSHRVRVVGDRVGWLPAGERRARFTAPRPFRAMPLSWARAWGGRDVLAAGWRVCEANPAGRGYWCDDGWVGVPAAWRERAAAMASAGVGVPRLPMLPRGVDRYGPLPNLLPLSGWPGPDDIVRPSGDGGGGGGDEGPAGFGWRAGHWAGVEGLNRAPAGLQVAHPGGGVELALLHLRPGAARVALRLPNDFPRVYWNAGFGRVPVPVALDAITVDADAGWVDLVWRGTLAMAAERRSAAVVPRLVEVDGVFRRWAVPFDEPIARPDLYEGGVS